MKVAAQPRARGTRDPRGGTQRERPSRKRVERLLRLTGVWAEAAAEVEHQDAVCHAARHAGVTVAAEALQGAVDAFRGGLGLVTVSDTLDWLAQAGLTLEEVESEIEVRVLEDELCDRLGRSELEGGFRKTRIRFDSVLLRVFVVDDLASGSALAARLRDARGSPRVPDLLEHCVGRRMEWGWFLREELPERAAVQIFKILPGAVIGPIQIGEGRYALYGVEAFRPASLEAEIEYQIRKELVAEKARTIADPDDPGRFVLK